MINNELRELTKGLPQKPGIYLFKDARNKPLYIGKALNLKNRVGHYLKTDDTRLKRMILESKKVDFIETDSDIEALILESQYIKKIKPPFNIVLRDDKQYGFVGFTHSTSSGQAGEEFPKILITHQPTDNINFIGPFTDVGALRTTLRLLRKIFPYCTCKQLHNNYCLNYHIGKCLGLCCLKNNPELVERAVINKEYNKNIKAIKDILTGKKESLIKQLEKEMHDLGKKEKFEEAIILQYKIDKLKRVFQNAQIIQKQSINYYGVISELQEILKLSTLPNRIEAYDIANIQGKHAVGAMVVFQNGLPDKNSYRKFKIYSKDTADDTGMLREILSRRLNHPEWPYPDLIIIDGGKGQLNVALSVASSMQQVARVKIIALTKNERHIAEKITLENKQILLSKLPPELKNFLIGVDAEAHRFAISFYRRTHRKTIKIK